MVLFQTQKNPAGPAHVAGCQQKDFIAQHRSGQAMFRKGEALKPKKWRKRKEVLVEALRKLEPLPLSR